MANFAHRSREPEWMDAPDVSQAEFAACLADLAAVNTVTFTRPPTLAFVARALAAAPQGTAPVVLDVGFGAGDMLRAIERMVRREGLRARLVGIDLNPNSEPYARSQTQPSSAIEYRTGNLTDWPHSEPPGLVISSQVTHHMDDAEILRFLAWMEANTSLGWLVSDLHRHCFAFHGFRLLATLMRWHPMVRHDGPISVLRGFTRGEWEQLLGEAGLESKASIRWHPLFRHTIARAKW